MANLGWTIFTAPLEEVDAGRLRTFLDELRREAGFLENTTLELKRSRDRHNVTTAIAAMANGAGGVILVGIDEDEPDFDAAPGVSADEGVSLLEACHGQLTPRITPEITTVAVPGKETVVLVVRVPSDPNSWPVVKQGQVFVRNYGQSPKATHDQIIELVERRRASAAPSGVTFTVANSFATRAVSEEDRPFAADLVVRVATAIYSRPLAHADLVFTKEIRDALDDGLRTSTIARLGVQNLARGASAAARPLELSDGSWQSTQYRVTGTRTGLPESQRIVLEVKRSGNQLAFMIEVQLRVPSEGARQTAPRVERGELAAVVLCLLETLALEITPLIGGLSGGAPSGVDDIVCWAESHRGAGLSASLDLSRATRPVPHEIGVWQFQFRHPLTQAEIEELLEENLRVLYLDLGVDDDDELAAEDLQNARRVRTALRP